MGLIHLTFCFTFEFINMVILFSKPNVYLTIVSYITVNLLVDLSKIYYDKTVDSDQDDVVKNVFDEKNLLKNDSKNERKKYEKRGWFTKSTWYLYTFLRAMYASIVFYFVPFLYIVFN